MVPEPATVGFPSTSTGQFSVRSTTATPSDSTSATSPDAHVAHT